MSSRKIAILVAILFAVAGETGALAMQGLADWMEALRPLTRGPSDSDHKSKPPVATIQFSPQRTDLSASAKTELDALAQAMASTRWNDYLFEIGWYATEKAPRSLSEQRAAALYEYLLAQPGISKARLELRQLPRMPPEIGERLPSNALAIKVENLGR